MASIADIGLTLDVSWLASQRQVFVDLAEDACAGLAKRASIPAEEIVAWPLLDDLRIYPRGATEVLTAPVVELGYAVIALVSEGCLKHLVLRMVQRQISFNMPIYSVKPQSPVEAADAGHSAVLYARVSSKEGYSIRAQQELLRPYGAAMVRLIEQEFLDVETAKKLVGRDLRRWCPTSRSTLPAVRSSSKKTGSIGILGIT